MKLVRVALGSSTVIADARIILKTSFFFFAGGALRESRNGGALE